VAFLRRRNPPTRTELLDQAARAAGRGRRKKAIELYRRVLEERPGDHVTRGKLAPLLAVLEDWDGAWNQYQQAAQGYLQDGFRDKAISLYKQAAGHFPQRSLVWERITELQLACGRRADALETLRRARRHFRGRAGREGAIRLCRRALAIDPTDFPTAYELGRLLLRAGLREDALSHLDGLARCVRGAELRQVRGLLLRADPSAGRLWQWLRAAVSGR
jgi:tetratricopeptide (TPR) repeat protein